MSEEYLHDERLYRERDAGGNVTVLRPAERARPTAAQLPQQAAAEFLTTHANQLDIQAGWLDGGVTAFVDGDDLPDDDEIALVFDTEQRQFDTTTVAFQQTWNGIPVWRSGTTVTMKQEPARVTGVRNSTYPDIAVDRPTLAKLRANVTGRRGLAAKGLGLGEAPVLAADVDPAARVATHHVDSKDGRVHIISNRVVVYRYDADRRTTDVRVSDDATPVATTHAGNHVHGHDVAFPLPIPDVDGVEDGAFRLCREVIFSIPTPPRGRIVWLALVDIDTGGVLLLRPFTADVAGMVFERDPLTQGGAANPESNQATLDTFRSSVTLLGLTAPAAGDDQELIGEHVEVVDFELFDHDPPTEPVGTNFNFNSRTNDFAAVNAYVHNDWFFRLVVDLGFDRDDYFGSTSFPLDVDHRGRFGSTDGIEINASCSGNGMSGIANVDYELASLTDTANPIGLAVDRRIVLHELGGHGILYPHVNWANFGFSHSAGDSFAAVLCDPDSQAADRFLTFPFVGSIITRRHDRPVGGGWGWGGSNDVGGYPSESILSTSHFRLYRSLGGDATNVNTRRFAARVVSYLMLRAVGTLTPATNPDDATEWVQAMLDADAGDWTSEGLAGGAYGKVIRWAFEKQGLYQAPGSPTPVAQEGAPPAVDVYIDDGRHGEYQYQRVHWNCQNVWNRRFADNGTAQEEPLLGQPNFCYVRVRNRGTVTADNVVVRGFHCNPGAGLTWPDDWQAMTTASIDAPDIPPGGEVTVGPFTWTPSQPDHECLLMVATADGDPSNIDVFGPGESIPEWRLVPHDNNIGQRNVHPVPAAGGIAGIMAVLDGRAFTVRNPFDRRVKLSITTELPSVLGRRDWQVGFANPGGGAFSLAPGQSRKVTLAVTPGAEPTASDVTAAGDRAVNVFVEADGILIGGMSYELDPTRAHPLPQPHHPGKGDGGTDCDDPCADTAEDLLRCMQLPGHRVDRVRVRTIGVDIDIDNC
ncbi:MAG: hypothetical protein CL424_10655 [Acidimicrobiaceae bacterium]|nr:hypothetical protein [Acidimicrobiaceae bacterium]